MTAVAPLPITTIRLPAAVEVRGPVLGVHDLPGEVLAAGEVRAVALVVAVVAGAHVQEGAGELTSSPVSVRCTVTVQRARSEDQLARIARWEKRISSLDPVGRGGVADVAQDRGPVGDSAGILPGPEGVAHREHVGVRADAGIAEQVPGPADRLARLEDRDRGAGEGPAQVAGGADSRQAGAEDQDVEVLLAGGILARGSLDVLRLGAVPRGLLLPAAATERAREPAREHGVPRQQGGGREQDHRRPEGALPGQQPRSPARSRSASRRWPRGTCRTVACRRRTRRRAYQRSVCSGIAHRKASDLAAPDGRVHALDPCLELLGAEAAFAVAQLERGPAPARARRVTGGFRPAPVASTRTSPPKYAAPAAALADSLAARLLLVSGAAS